MPDQQTDLAFCQDQLRKFDPLHHFMALASLEIHRPALMVLHCFLDEIERIPLQVSEPTMGEIRLQWWLDVIARENTDLEGRDGLENIGPVASCLKLIQRNYNLSPDHLIQIIEARKFDLYNDPMPDWDTFETYAGETQALPLLLAAQILNDGIVPEISDLCGNAAMAICLTKQLTNFARNANRQKLYLPFGEFSEAQVNEAQIWVLESEEDIISVLKPIANKSHDHHVQAQQEFNSLKEKGQAHLGSAFLELALVSARLKQWKKKPLAPKNIPLWKQYWSIWRYGR